MSILDPNTLRVSALWNVLIGAQLLVGASGVVRDIYQRTSTGATAAQEQLFRLSRLTVLGIVVFGTLVRQHYNGTRWRAAAPGGHGFSPV